VRVPDAFFKVVLAGVEKGKPKAIGFVYKNASGNRKLDAYVNSVDEVERITGYDFFPALPDQVEQAVEKQCDLNAWK
jgi:endonuclease G